jgi:hypothetical protein
MRSNGFEAGKLPVRSPRHSERHVMLANAGRNQQRELEEGQ